MSAKYYGEVPVHQRQPSSTALVRFLRRPNRRRLESVVQKHYGDVFRVALRATNSHEEAADVAQEVFLSLIVEPPPPGSVRSPRGFLIYRVLGLVQKRRRSHERRRKREMAAARSIVQREHWDDLDLKKIREALEELPEPARSACELRYPMTLPETATAQHVTIVRAGDGLERRVQLNDEGALEVAALRPGRWTVTRRLYGKDHAAIARTWSIELLPGESEVLRPDTSGPRYRLSGRLVGR